MRIAGSWKGYGIAFFSAVLVCGGPPTVGVGYLARVGPSPLRFRSEFHRKAAEVLPPLPPPEESNSTPPPEIPTPQNDVEVPDLDPELFAPVFPTPESSSPPGAAVPAPNNGPMVPQMLLQYFVRGTNQNAVVTAPVEFTPPPPPANRSSAVYISK